MNCLGPDGLLDCAVIYLRLFSLSKEDFLVLLVVVSPKWSDTQFHIFSNIHIWDTLTIFNRFWNYENSSIFSACQLYFKLSEADVDLSWSVASTLNTGPVYFRFNYALPCAAMSSFQAQTEESQERYNMPSDEDSKSNIQSAEDTNGESNVGFHVQSYLGPQGDYKWRYLPL